MIYQRCLIPIVRASEAPQETDAAQQTHGPVTAIAEHCEHGVAEVGGWDKEGQRVIRSAGYTRPLWRNKEGPLCTMSLKELRLQYT
jgi:hypothetical protein